MKLTSQEEYGLRCVLQLARHGGSLTLPELARFEGIGLAHTAKLMRVLRRAGLVKSTRGQAGGYTLALPPTEVRVGHVLAALGGRFFDERFCERHSGVAAACRHLGDCSIRPVLRRVQDVVDEVLGRLTLGDLLAGEGSVPAALPASPRAIALPLAPR